MASARHFLPCIGRKTSPLKFETDTNVTNVPSRLEVGTFIANPLQFLPASLLVNRVQRMQLALFVPVFGESSCSALTIRLVFGDVSRETPVSCGTRTCEAAAVVLHFKQTTASFVQRAKLLCST